MAALRQNNRVEDPAFLWPIVEKLDEQRQHPRIELDVAVAFRNGAGQHCTAMLLNIAPDGIQIRCNVATAQILHPGGGKICPRNISVVQTSIAIPLTTGSSTLSLYSRLMYLATVPEEPRCVIGLRFLDRQPTAQHIIDQFFAERRHERHCPGVPVPHST